MNTRLRPAKTVRPLPLVFAAFLVLFFACGGGPSKRVEKDLTVILKDDLNGIVSELPDTAVLDSPYYQIVTYQYFPKDERFSYKAVVDFYYFKSIHVKQVRKYRYQRLQKKWDRYSKQYQNLPDSLLPQS